MLQGFKCPDGKKVSFEECLSKDCTGCLPRLMRLGILIKSQYRDPNEISVTNLTSGCLRKIYWEKTKPYWVSPSKSYSGFRGSLVHEIMALAVKKYEGADNLCKIINDFTGNLLIEEKFSRDIDGVLLSGTMDMYNRGSQELVDFKSLKDAIYILKEGHAREDHVAQTNIYRYLMKDLPVKRIRIVYVTMDKVYQTGEIYTIERKHKAGNITEEYSLAEIPIWSDIQVLEYVRPRLKTLSEALKNSDKLPEGVDESHRWLCGVCTFREWCDLSGSTC